MLAFSEVDFVRFCARCREVVAALLRVGGLCKSGRKAPDKSGLLRLIAGIK